MIYDYIVIGAGPAGCFSAVELKNKGYSVCILEKQKKNYVKVCGGGLSMAAVEVLKRMCFPLERLEGQMRISKYFYYKEKNLYTRALDAEKGELAYGMNRLDIDRLFRDYAQLDWGISITYESEVKNIIKEDNCYIVNGLSARNLIVALGANGSVMLQGQKLIGHDPYRPFGVSAVVRGKKVEEPFYLFDYQEKYAGTYAWIFTIGEDLYNVGLWLRQDIPRIREYFTEFYNSRGKSVFGDDAVTEIPLRGSFMGIGKRTEPHHEHIYFVGDAVNTSNPMDGEGISKAIIDAKLLTGNID